MPRRACISGWQLRYPCAAVPDTRPARHMTATRRESRVSSAAALKGAARGAGREAGAETPVRFGSVESRSVGDGRVMDSSCLVLRRPVFFFSSSSSGGDDGGGGGGGEEGDARCGCGQLNTVRILRL
ncbi:unnamed protein product [Merluccius merluccius]